MTRLPGLGLKAAIVGGLLAAPGVAWACPQCAGRSGGGVMLGLLIGAMIAFPFGVVAVVVRAIRREERES